MGMHYWWNCVPFEFQEWTSWAFPFHSFCDSFETTLYVRLLTDLFHNFILLSNCSCLNQVLVSKKKLIKKTQFYPIVCLAYRKNMSMVLTSFASESVWIFWSYEYGSSSHSFLYKLFNFYISFYFSIKNLYSLRSSETVKTCGLCFVCFVMKIITTKQCSTRREIWSYNQKNLYFTN